MLIEFEEDVLAKDIAVEASESVEPTEEQVSFIADFIVQPLVEKLGASEPILWFSLQRQPLLPGRFSMVDTAVTESKTEAFLKLFPYAVYRIYFFTTKILLIIPVIDWLEKQKNQVYSLSSMDYVVVGKMYDRSMSSR